ncbi:MAG: response regulator transcription factor [Bacteroidetes bacterium]|nr:response regulator transcription factor [Bacteroidota bacterium]
MTTADKKIRTVIVDDEPGNVVTLTGLLKLCCPDIEITAVADDYNSGIEVINRVKPALVFLDIEMPYGTGFDLLDKLSPVQFEVIFVTAFSNYAIRAFRYAALDYLLKPVNINELKAAVARAKQRLDEKSTGARVALLLNNLQSSNGNFPKIGLPAEEGFYFEDIVKIMYIEASGSYTYLYIKGRKKQLVSRSLKEFEELLPEEIFYRIHHSFVINMAFAKKYHKGRGGQVEMEDGAMIPVAVRKRDQFLEKFQH